MAFNGLPLLEHPSSWNENIKLEGDIGSEEEEQMAASSNNINTTSQYLHPSQHSYLTPPQTHTRVYQACIPCRRRKVRCDLGPVDRPHDPPCQRCRRENKDCYFSAERRKRKGDEELDEAEELEAEQHQVRSGKRRFKGEPSDASPHSVGSGRGRTSSRDASASYAPLTPGGSIGQSRPLRRPVSQPPQSSDEEDEAMNNGTAAILQRSEVYTGHDALNLLYEAAGHNGDLARDRSGSLSKPTGSRTDDGAIESSKFGGTEVSDTGQMEHGSSARQSQGSTKNATIQGSSSTATVVADTDSLGYQQALRTWSHFRFVRAGWFTAAEAIDYIDYYYTFLKPMTPIQIPDFQTPSKHGRLLSDEPMLAITLLTIASRYKTLTGPGALTRGFGIHDKLWHYLQGMITRMYWAQEQFGGGFCGAGRQSSNESTNGPQIRLRSLGTIESLLLLTEWHTRALHFPPGDDIDELVAPDYATEDAQLQNAGSSEGSGNGRGLVHSSHESLWRSDRMCWSLLGSAMALAYELGIYSEGSKQPSATRTAPGDAILTHGRRSENVRRLLFIYITQTSGRLNLPSMLPDKIGQPLFSDAFLERTNAVVNALRKAAPRVGAQHSDTEFTYDVVLWFWFRLATITKDANESLFFNRQHIRALIATDRYRQEMQRFEPDLIKWKKDLDSCDLIPARMRIVLEIEFQYIRVFINGLTLAAIVSRCIVNTPMRAHAELVNGTSEVDSRKLPNENGPLPSGVLLKHIDGDRPFIKDLVQACQAVLRSVVDGLLPGEYLKHAPVRTYFRIITTSMILIQTFLVGMPEDEAARSFVLLQRTIDALRACIVDDVHVGSRIAVLISTLSRQVRKYMVRIPDIGGGSTSASRVDSRWTSPSPAPENVRPEKLASAVARAAMNGISRPSFANSQQWNAAQPQTVQPQQQHSAAVNNGARQYPTDMTYSQPMNNPYFATSQWDASLQPQTQLIQDPLYGIKMSTYDPNNPTFSIMPPPSFNVAGANTNYDTSNGIQPTDQSFGTNGYNDMNLNGAAGDFGGDQNLDWLVWPIDNVLQYARDTDITQTGFGPELGGHGLIDVMLTDDWMPNGSDGGLQ